MCDSSQGLGVRGFSISQQPPQGSKVDDTAANQLQLFCEDGSLLSNGDLGMGLPILLGIRTPV